MTPGSPSLTMHQSWPGVRRRRDSQPSIHLPRSVYFPSIQTGASGFTRFSFSAKKSSLVATATPPSRADARSMRCVKSDTAITIHETAARPRFVHASTKAQSRVRGALVPLMQARLVDGEFRVGIPDDEIGVLPGLDRALAIVETRKPRRGGREPRR